MKRSSTYETPHRTIRFPTVVLNMGLGSRGFHLTMQLMGETRGGHQNRDCHRLNQRSYHETLLSLTHRPQWKNKFLISVPAGQPVSDRKVELPLLTEERWDFSKSAVTREVAQAPSRLHASLCFNLAPSNRAACTKHVHARRENRQAYEPGTLGTLMHFSWIQKVLFRSIVCHVWLYLCVCLLLWADQIRNWQTSVLLHLFRWRRSRQRACHTRGLWLHQPRKIKIKHLYCVVPLEEWARCGGTLIKCKDELVQRSHGAKRNRDTIVCPRKQ